MAPDPQQLWDDLAGWHDVGSNEPVFRVLTDTGNTAYVRPDDGSADLLNRLTAGGRIPVPRVLRQSDEWLLLGALPGEPLHNPVWINRPSDAAAVTADALVRLEAAGVTHGDMCLPNILGDPATGELSGIIDWRYAGRYDREIDVASAIWSCGFNGYDPAMAVSALRGCGWPRTDEREVARLSAVWTALVDEEEAAGLTWSQVHQRTP
jgi:aminoglycoside phosphotransferase